MTLQTRARMLKLTPEIQKNKFSDDTAHLEDKKALILQTREEILTMELYNKREILEMALQSPKTRLTKVLQYKKTRKH